MLTLKDKEEYIVHYENLKFYLKMGMKLKRVHRVLEFEQECWMEPYIRQNTEYRKKAESDFEKDFYKLMNNSVFGKTMENLQKRIDIKIVRSDEKEKIRKLVAKPAYARHVIFTNNMAGVHMRKTKMLLNKPVYVGMTILEKSKLLMYDYFYGVLKREYGAKCELLYTDTDSFVLEVETEDYYKDMERRKELYDTSNYPKEDKLYSNENKKVLGKMKDEGGGVPVAEFVALKAKMYSIMMGDEKNVKKAKGVKRCVVKKEINNEQYKEALFGEKLFRHGMEIIRSEGHAHQQNLALTF